MDTIDTLWHLFIAMISIKLQAIFKISRVKFIQQSTVDIRDLLLQQNREFNLTSTSRTNLIKFNRNFVVILKLFRVKNEWPR